MQVRLFCPVMNQGNSWVPAQTSRATSLDGAAAAREMVAAKAVRMPVVYILNVIVKCVEGLCR